MDMHPFGCRTDLLEIAIHQSAVVRGWSEAANAPVIKRYQTHEILFNQRHRETQMRSSVHAKEPCICRVGLARNAPAAGGRSKRGDSRATPEVESAYAIQK